MENTFQPDRPSIASSLRHRMTNKVAAINFKLR